MAGPRILVAEGNVPEVRRRSIETGGATPSESYAAVLRAIAPDAQVDICFPADADPALPAPLDSYDGIAITGSALNIHKLEEPSLRQIEFVRAAFARGIPMFGSCWGLQVAAVAAGGEVAHNPRGREVAFARKIKLTAEGRAHPMHAGREPVFDAPAIHADEVVRLPDGAVVTAGNAVSAVQAAEIRLGKGVFWGVQYHPEYRLHDVAAVVRRYGQILVTEGFFTDLDQLDRYVADLSELHRDNGRADVAWRLALGEEILQPDKRVCEIANWVRLQVRGTPEAGPMVGY